MRYNFLLFVDAKKLTLNSPKVKHFLHLATFFCFNIFLISIDVVSDFATSINFYNVGHHKWALATLLPIFAPFLIRYSLA